MADVDDALFSAYAEPAPSGVPVEATWGEQGRNLAAAGFDLAGGVSAGTQYLTGAEEDSIPARIRRWATENAAEQRSKIRPDVQRSMAAGVLPGDGPDIWDKDVDASTAIGSKIIGTIPALAALLGTGALATVAGGPLVGMAATGAASGMMTGGDLYKDLQEKVLSAPQEQMDESPIYKELVASGFSDGEARQYIVERAAGNLPLIMGGLSALIGPLGAEGAVIGRVAGARGASGVAGRTARAGATEAGTEFIEEGSQEWLKQRGEMEVGLRAERDNFAAIQAAATGAVVGGVVGGAVGAVAGPKKYLPEVTPDGVSGAQQQALNPGVSPQIPPAPPPATANQNQPPPSPGPGVPPPANTNVDGPPEAAPGTPPGLAAIKRRIEERKALNKTEPSQTPQPATPPPANDGTPPPSVQDGDVVDLEPDETEAQPSAAPPVETPAPPVETPAPPVAKGRRRTAAPATPPSEPVEMAGRPEDIPALPDVNPVAPENRPLMVEPSTSSVLDDIYADEEAQPAPASTPGAARAKAVVAKAKRKKAVAPADETGTVTTAEPERSPGEVSPRPSVAASTSTEGFTPPSETRSPSAAEGESPSPSPVAAQKGEGRSPLEKPRVLVDLVAEQKMREAQADDVRRWLEKAGVKSEEDLDKETLAGGSRTSKKEVERIAKGEARSFTMPETAAELETRNGRRTYRALVERIVSSAAKENVEPPVWAKAAADEFKRRGRASKGPAFERSKITIRATWEEARDWMAKAATQSREVGREAEKKINLERIESDRKAIREAAETTPIPRVRNMDDLGPAMREYARKVVDKLKGVEIPAKMPDGISDEYQALVRHLRSLRVLAANPLPRDTVRDIFANDLMIRNGQYDSVIETARVEGEVRSKKGEFRDDGGEDTGRDAATADDRDSAEQADSVTDVTETIAEADMSADADPNLDELDDTPERFTSEGKRQPEPDAEPDTAAPVYGAAKKPTVVETVKRRALRKPGAVPVKPAAKTDPDPDPEPPKGGKKPLPKKLQEKVDTARRLKVKVPDDPKAEQAARFEQATIDAARALNQVEAAFSSLQDWPYADDFKRQLKRVRGRWETIVSSIDDGRKDAIVERMSNRGGFFGDGITKYRIPGTTPKPLLDALNRYADAEGVAEEAFELAYDSEPLRVDLLEKRQRPGVYTTGKGFVADVLHGTNEAFDQFQNAFKNSKFLSGFDAFWFTDNARVANAYTRRLMTQRERDAGADDTSGGNIRLSRIAMENPFVAYMDGAAYDPMKFGPILKRAREAGHDGVVFKNTIDGGDVESTVFAVFDADQISDTLKADRPAGQRFPKMTQGGDRGAPTQAMLEAGNYRKEKVRLPRAEVTIETKAGQKRSGVNPDGTPWSVTMPVDYGYINRTRSSDGEQLDVFLHPEARTRFVQEYPVFVIDQMDLKTGKFDEPKAMVGFPSLEEALSAYDQSFSDGRGLDRVMAVQESTYNEFLMWAFEPATAASGVRDRIMQFGAEGSSTGTVEVSFAEIEPVLGSVPPTSRYDALVEFALERFSRAIPDTRIVMQNDEDHMKAVVDGFYDHPRFAEFFANPPPAWYDASTNTIHIRQSRINDLASARELLAHEGLHALYHSTIDRSPRERKAILSMLDRVRAFVVDEARRRGDTRVQLPYGLTNEHEFLSEAFSDRAFQGLLARVPAQAADMAGMRYRSVWDALVGRLLQVLNKFRGKTEPKFSILDAVMRVEQSLWENRTSGGNPSAARHLPSLTTGVVVDIARDQGAAANSKFWRWIRRGATLDQLRQAGVRAKLFLQGGIDHLDSLVRAAQRAYEYQKTERLAGEKHATRLAEFAKVNPREAAMIGDLLLEASRLNLNIRGNNDHLKGVKAKQAQAALPALERDYDSLSAEAKSIHAELRDYFRDTQDRMLTGTLTNILEAGTQLSAAQIRTLVAKTKARTLDQADEALINSKTVFSALKNAAEVALLKGTYFPFMRHGNFVVTTHTAIKNLMGGTQVGADTVAFSAMSDRAAAIAQAEAFAESVYRNQDLTVGSVQVAYFDGAKQITRKDAESLGTPYRVEARVFVQTRGLYTFESEAQAIKFIRDERKNFSDPGSYIDPKPMVRDEFFAGPELTSRGIDALVRSINVRDDLTPSQKKAMKQSMQDVAAMMLSGYQVKHSLIRRRNVRGYSEDVVRSTASYADMAARTLTKIKFRPGMNLDLEAMRRMAEDRTAKGTLRAERSGMLQEIERRLESGDFSPEEPGKIVQGIMTLSMFDKLMSPAYSVVNALQVGMVTYPYLAGRYGSTRTGAAIARAYADIGLGDAVLDGVVNTAKAVKGWSQIQLLNTRDIFGDIKKAINNPAEAAMLDALIERGAMGGNTGFEVAHPEMQGAGAFGRALSKTDRIARQLPLAVEDVNRSVTALAAYRLAMADGKTAQEATDIAFDTVLATQGDYRAFNAPPIFNNPIMRPALQFKKYAQLMTAMIGDMAYQSFRNSSAKERRIAQKQLTHLLAVQVLMAGSLSLPGIEIAKASFLVAAALGFGEGWEHRERQLRKLHDEALGKTWGELVSRGVLSRAIGLDLSTRLTLADMWLPFGEPKTFDQEGLLGYFGKFMFGAPGSLVLDWGTAVRLSAEGRFADAAIRAFPAKFVSDTQTAIRDWNKGESTSVEGPLKAFGFRSARQAEEAERRSESIDRTQMLARDYSRLSRAYRDATTGAERSKILIEINKHNAKAPLRYKVFPKALDRGRAQDDARRRALQGG